MSSLQPDWLTKEYLENVLKKIFNQDTAIRRYEVSAGSNLGDGYASQIYRIKIEAKNDKLVSIIGKELTTDAHIKKMDEKFRFYYKEKLVLETMFPKMLEKLTDETRFYPEFYHADDSILTLFVEDLCHDNYRLCERSSGIDLKHSLLVMEALAKLHATSYLVFQDEPQLTKHFELGFYSEENAAFVGMMIDNACKGLSEISYQLKVPEEHKAKLRNSENWTFRLIDTWKRKGNSINVLLHNDCWVNNLMFKYDEGGVQGVKLIDFQLGTYNSFALDLLKFIYANTSTDVRMNSMDKLLNRYYTVFTSIAKIPDFTMETMTKEIKERLFMAFIATVTGVPMVMAPPNKKAIDLDSVVNNKESAENTKIFKNPKFLDLLEKTLPYFVQNNVI